MQTKVEKIKTGIQDQKDELRQKVEKIKTGIQDQKDELRQKVEAAKGNQGPTLQRS